jgi:hypothetical protein
MKENQCSKTDQDTLDSHRDSINRCFYVWNLYCFQFEWVEEIVKESY